LCGLLLIVPATLMGTTLPVLSRFYVRSTDSVGLSVGTLYAVNTLGAVLGAMATGFVLIPSLGVSGTIRLACGLSALASAGSYLLSRRAPAPGDIQAGQAAGPAGQAADADTPHTHGVLMAILVGYAFAGAAAMLYEIAWTRVISLLIGSTVYAFSMMLTSFILGLALGSMVAAGVVDRLRHPLRALAIIEILVGLSSLLVLPFVDRLPLHVTGWLAWTEGSFWQLQFVQFSLILVIMLAPTILMGAAFPVANRLLVIGRGAVGRGVGSVYCWNTLGCVVGSFVGGFLLIPWIGIQHTLFAAALINVLVGGMLLFCRRGGSVFRRVAPAGAALALAAGVIAWMPPWDASRMSFGPFVIARRNPTEITSSLERLEEITEKRNVLYHKEGLTTTVTVTESEDGQRILLVNGKPDASSEGDLPTQELLAHIPLLLHPEPRRVLVIGLGSGITLGSAGLYPVETLDCAEISPAVIAACRYFDEYNYRILDDPRVRIIVADGRNHVALTDSAYDVIISEPSNPWIAGVADLFTLEFFRSCRDRLRDRGIVCIWIETYTISDPAFRSIVRTFQSVFPNATLWSPVTTSDYFLLGVKGDLSVDHAEMARRMASPAVAADLRRIHISSPADLLCEQRMDSAAVRRFASDATIHTDDNAFLEFSIPRTMVANTGQYELAEAIHRHPQVDLSFLTGTDAQALAEFRERAARFNQARGHMLLGTILHRQKRNAEALLEYRKAAALNPEDAELVDLIRENLASAAAYARQGKVDPAVKMATRVAQLDPKHAGARYLLGQLLVRQKLFRTALEHFLRAVQLEPERAEYRTRLADAAERLGKTDLAVTHYTRAIEIDADQFVAMNNLARILASDSNASRRDAPRAVTLAEQAVKLTERKNPNILSTLAIAYANAERFDDALAAAGEALELADQAGNHRLAEGLRTRMELYKNHKPYRRPAPGGS